jgi:Phage tail lysozyme
MANLGAIINKLPQSLNKGATNFITSGPELADVSITSTYNTLVSGTNYYNIVASNGSTTFVTNIELITAIAYRNTFKQGDAVTAFNQFYNNLQTTTFANPECTFDTILYWANKLNYSNKELLALNNQGSIFGHKILPNLNPSVSQSIAQGFLNGLNAQQSFHQNGDNTSIGNLLGDLQPVAEGIASTLANAGVPNQSFFTNISDSIGTLANTKYIQTDSTLPIFDVNQQYYGVPIPYSASTDRKISNNTRNIAYNLSIATTALMRRNLLNIAYTQPAVQQNMASDATVAHGLNLINDLPTFAQLNTSLGNLVKSLSSRFKQAKVFQFVQYLNNIGNKTGFNLRDIFPVTGLDKDFTVVTSAQRSLASAAETKSISDAAIIDSYGEQQGINYANHYTPFVNGSSYNPSGDIPLPSPTDLGPNADPAAVAKQLGISQAAAQNAIVAYNTAYSDALQQGASTAQAQQIASAICGNIAQESGFNPNLVHDGGIGYGLLGENGDQLARLKQYAIQQGEDPNNISTKTQINALFAEPTFYSRNGFSGMLNASDASSASYNFAVKYLKPTVATANYQARANNAIAISNGSVNI